MKERYIQIYGEEKEVNEQYGMKMNQDISGNRLLWKEVGKVDSEREASWNKLKLGVLW